MDYHYYTAIPPWVIGFTSFCACVFIAHLVKRYLGYPVPDRWTEGYNAARDHWEPMVNKLKAEQAEELRVAKSEAWEEGSDSARRHIIAAVAAFLRDSAHELDRRLSPPSGQGGQDAAEELVYIPEDECDA